MRIESWVKRPRKQRETAAVCVPKRGGCRKETLQQNRKWKFLSRLTTATSSTAAVSTRLPEYQLATKESLPHLAGLAEDAIEKGGGATAFRGARTANDEYSVGGKGLGPRRFRQKNSSHTMIRAF